MFQSMLQKICQTGIFVCLLFCKVSFHFFPFPRRAGFLGWRDASHPPPEEIRSFQECTSCRPATSAFSDRLPGYDTLLASSQRDPTRSATPRCRFTPGVVIATRCRLCMLPVDLPPAPFPIGYRLSFLRNFFVRF